MRRCAPEFSVPMQEPRQHSPAGSFFVSCAARPFGRHSCGAQRSAALTLATSRPLSNRRNWLELSTGRGRSRSARRRATSPAPCERALRPRRRGRAEQPLRRSDDVQGYSKNGGDCGCSLRARRDGASQGGRGCRNPRRRAAAEFSGSRGASVCPNYRLRLSAACEAAARPASCRELRKAGR